MDPTSPPSTRRHDLDWIRVAAFGLLVLYHVGMYYVGWDWHVKSPAAGPALEPFMLLTSPWRLSLLFLVSGAASAFLFARRPAGFLGERTRRLLVPLLFGMAVLVVPQAYYEVVEQLPGGYHDGFLAFYGRYLAADQTFCDGDGCLTLPTWNHLWFLPYLWVYVVVAWVAVRASGPAARAAGRGRLERVLSGPGVLWLPILWLAAARLLLASRFESTHALVDDWYNHAQYLPLFLLGFALARSEAFWDAVRRQRRLALVLAVTSYALIVWCWYGAGYSEANPPPDVLRQLVRAAWGVNQWAAIVAILGFGQRLRHVDGPVLRYLVPAVLPVYMLHQTVIVVVAHNLQPLHIRPLLEGPLLVVVTFAACFAGYEIVRRVRWLRPLFGLKGNPAASARSKSLADVGERRPETS
ncbi:MAG TPA: acyltransferase family protein [Steroidobacteraceae bacterium]|nr:acyltransferase family protein [Steroidobacteraceae bacterium]